MVRENQKITDGENAASLSAREGMSAVMEKVRQMTKKKQKEENSLFSCLV